MEASSASHGRRILPALLATILGGVPCLQANQAFASGTSGRFKYEEYEVRTAFLLVFAKYTEWPENILPQGAPLVIGVMGEAPLGSTQEHFASSNINGRKVVIKRFPRPADLQPCHILYFPADQERFLPKLRERLAAGSVLTVGETSLFIGFGGALHLFNEEGRLRFTINRTILDRSHLRVEAKAMVLAKQVFDQSAEVMP